MATQQKNNHKHPIASKTIRNNVILEHKIPPTLLVFFHLVSETLLCTLISSHRK